MRSRRIFYDLLILAFITIFSHLLLSTVTDLVPKFAKNRLYDTVESSTKNTGGNLNTALTEFAKESIKNTTYNFLTENDLEVRVVASNRGNGYLLQTVGFLLEQQNHARFSIKICNTEMTGFDDLRFLKEYFEVYPIWSNLSHSNLNTSLYKESIDYFNCLEVDTRSRFVILLEDDSVVVDSFTDLVDSFTDLIKSLIQHLDRNGEIDYVKLYHPKKLRKIPFYPLIISFSLLMSFSVWICFRKPNFFYFLFYALILTYSLFKAGSEFPAELRYYITSSAYVSVPESCCTPAVIFRSSRIPKMVDYFRNSAAYSGHAKDHILDESPFVGRMSDMNYVIHIGAYSVVRNRHVLFTD